MTPPPPPFFLFGGNLLLLLSPPPPPLNHQTHTHPGDGPPVLALHPVARGQEDWVRHFGFRSGREVDKFAGLAWEPGRTGAPLLAEALGWLEGRVVDSLDCGDHTARLVEPVAVSLRDPAAVPLRAAEVYASGVDEPRAESVFPWES